MIQKRRYLPITSFAGIDHCPGILPRPILKWYIFMHSDDWGEDSLFEVHGHVSKKIVNRDANGRSTNVDVPGLLVWWQDIGMYNMINGDLLEV